MNRHHSQGFRSRSSRTGRQDGWFTWIAAAMFGVAVRAQRAHAAAFSSSATTPTVDTTDIANLGAATGYDKGLVQSAIEFGVADALIKTLTILTAALFLATGLATADQTNALGLSLIGNRFLTFNTVVRVRQIEVTRDTAHGPDESSVHTAAEARTFREAGQYPRQEIAQ